MTKGLKLAYVDLYCRCLHDDFEINSHNKRTVHDYKKVFLDEGCFKIMSPSVSGIIAWKQVYHPTAHTLEAAMLSYNSCNPRACTCETSWYICHICYILVLMKQAMVVFECESESAMSLYSTGCRVHAAWILLLHRGNKTKSRAISFFRNASW